MVRSWKYGIPSCLSLFNLLFVSFNPLLSFLSSLFCHFPVSLSLGRFHLLDFFFSLLPDSPFSFLWLFCHLSRRIRLSSVTRSSYSSSLHHRGLALSRCASLMRCHSFLLLFLSFPAGQSEPGSFLSHPPTFTMNTILTLRQRDAPEAR